MRPIALKLTMAAICLTLAFQPVDARGRNDNRGRSTRTESKNNRPASNHNRPGSGHNNRPGNNNRPNVGNGHSRPNHGHTPQVSNHHRPNPGHNFSRPTPPPPPRPTVHNHYHPWHRPTPPPKHWRPAPTWRPFSTILGIALGSAINYTVNSLINAGYNVSGYGNNAVYVTNVPMLGLMWPDATLIYGNGGLCGSEFIYPTSYYDMSRYYQAYNMLVANYGTPYNVVNNGVITTSTWWGSNNQFITLNYGNYNGGFATTLSFGN